MSLKEDIERVLAMTICAECGMACEGGEYHPFAACLMFKGCGNSGTVRANLPPRSRIAAPFTGEGND